MKIPIHRMTDKFSGVYMSPLESVESPPAYEVSQPHRHDFYYCVLLDKGEIEFEADFERVKITDQSLFLSYPEQVHRVVSHRPECGWFLAFDPAMLDEQLRAILEQFLTEIVLLPISPEQSAAFSSFMNYLYTVYNDETQLFRQTVVQSLVVAFVYQLASAYLSIERFQLIRHSTRSIEITKNFKQILRRNFREMKRPSEFAAKMNITASYLNDTVRAVTGFPVTFYIQQELMREAQRLLYNSDLTVKQIADKLGFEDDKYFNRLFSKVMGVSPGAFRKSSVRSLMS